MSEVRLIDADALKEDIEMQVKMLDAFGIEDLRLIGNEIRKGMIAEIDKQPTVDAVPVRHGYNKQFEFPSQFTCSVCGWESWDTYCGDTDTFNYCPNCGAKMDGADGKREEKQQ